MNQAPAWNSIDAHYYAKSGALSLLSLVASDEGLQQEQLGIWLTDSLDSQRVVHSPQVRENGKSRELTDLLINTATGPILIESKALTVIGRGSLPELARLRRDTTRNLKKAADQLAGAVRSIRRGLAITEPGGTRIEIDPQCIAHAIVLVPDLNLLSGVTQFGGSFVREMSARMKSIIQILDPAELLRVVQAATKISSQSKGGIGELAALDQYLLERAKVAAKEKTPDFGVLLRSAGATSAPNTD